mmetsp:Transcript_33148/g.104865  ORF Transcript_33148/g.104865 Transcript_33148/m.104865 type:complete len:224 (-) Transcript_33148:708-1379(-)
MGTTHAHDGDHDFDNSAPISSTRAAPGRYRGLRVVPLIRGALPRLVLIRGWLPEERPRAAALRTNAMAGGTPSSPLPTLLMEARLSRRGWKRMTPPAPTERRAGGPLALAGMSSIPAACALGAPSILAWALGCRTTDKASAPPAGDAGDTGLGSGSAAASPRGSGRVMGCPMSVVRMSLMRSTRSRLRRWSRKSCTMSSVDAPSSYGTPSLSRCARSASGVIS